MTFDWEKNCITKNCYRKVWETCITNTRCRKHCNCPENKNLPEKIMDRREAQKVEKK